jgi:hypothetical protein
MSDLIVRTDVRLRGIDNMLAAAGPRGNVAWARALNRTGGPVSTATKRSIRKVLGLRQHPNAKQRLGDVLKRSTSQRKATAANLEYSLAGFGKGLPLIFYQPKEAPAGASVNWLGTRKTIKRSFYLSGKFPRRKRSNISDRVSERVGKGRWKLARPLGASVPDAMNTPAIRSAWESQAAARLPHNLRSALEAVLRGY